MQAEARFTTPMAMPVAYRDCTSRKLRPRKVTALIQATIRPQVKVRRGFRLSQELTVREHASSLGLR